MLLFSRRENINSSTRFASSAPKQIWPTLWLALCVFFVAFALPLPAQEAAPSADSAANAAEESAIPLAPVQVGGRILFEIVGEDSADALRRADKVNRRLERLVDRVEEVPRFEPRDVVDTPVGASVLLGGEEIITVTPADVQHYLTPAPELAQQWGERMSRVVQGERLARSGTLNNIAVLMFRATLDLTRSLAAWLPRLLGAIVLALVFWMLARFIRWITLKATLSRRLDPNLRQLSLAISFYGVWALGILAMLSALGIDSASIAATVGVSGFILGFAFKDVLSHFLAGLMLLVGRQFSIGGDIVVGEYEGTVENIDLRALHLRTYDNRLVTIPNGDVFNSAVIANTHNRYRRRDFSVGISYADDTRRAIDIALRTVQGVSGVLIEPPPQVVASSFGDSSVNLKVYFYINTTGTDPLAVLSECILRVKERFASEGITIPYNIIDLHYTGDGKPLVAPKNREF